MRHSRAVLGTIALALGVVLVGCSRGPEPAEPRKVEPIQTASSPSANPTPEDSIACKLLSDKERRSIAGEDIKIVSPAAPVKDIDQCRWVKTLKSAAPTMVQVTVTPAQVWARSVPAQVDSALRSGRGTDTKVLDKLLAAKKKLRLGSDKLSDKEACGMFSLLAQSRGLRKNVTETLAFPPIGTQIGAQARTCRDGIYATVTYAEIGLKPSTALSQAVLRLVKIAHARAVQLNYGD
jgi:hypothetical protein